jgi:meso-butanediol dehydrogenase / (S,S)-butanediol dehydrogenase / diacetyl reductase
MGATLDGKVILLTGAGTGIARACALAFAQEGASLALIGRRKEKLETVAKECAGSPLIVPADLAKKTEVDRAITETITRFDRLDVLVNNAGILFPGTVEEITEAQWDQTFQLNVKSVWQLSRAALPHFRKTGGGVIINVASVLGINGARKRASYAPSKGAVVLLTKCMAIDHGHENIRVNAICTSFVETDLTAAVIAGAPDPEAVRRERIGVHPIGRLGRPEDIAGLAIFLASDAASWVTGAIYPVDGGYLAV